MATLLHYLEHPLVVALGWSLLHFVWQGLLVAALLAVLLMTLRRASSRLRYLVLCGGMCVMALCPIATWLTVAPETKIIQPSALKVEAAQPLVTRENVEPSLPPLATAPVVPLQAPSEAPSWQARVKHGAEIALPALVIGWLLGVLVLSARLLVGWQTVRRLTRLATIPASAVWHARLQILARRLGVSHPVKLVETALVEVPTVIGWLRPVILLPASALIGLEPSQLEALLAHELAHIRRHDYLVNLLQTAIETLLFYHPAVWWLSRRIRQEREHCCDDLAVEVCGDHVGYARALAMMEELRGGPQLSLAADGGSLLTRIRRLRNTNGDARRGNWGASLIALSTILVLCAGAYVAQRASAQPAEDPMKAKLTATAAPEKATIMAGEPTWLKFIVTNRSREKLQMIVGGDYRNRLGRPESFTVEAVDEQGRKATLPDAGHSMGGISVANPLPPQGEVPFELFLPHWASDLQPGRYRITIRRRCELVPDGQDAFRAKPETVDVAAQTTLQVVAADPAKIGELIEEWGPKLLGQHSEDSERAAKMLRALRDERVIPWFIKLLDQPSGSRKLTACDGLAPYGTDTSLAALKRAMQTTADEIRDTTTRELAESSADAVHHAAIVALSANPHPEAAQFVLAQASDRYWGVRITVLHLAAKLKTKEAREVIERLTKDTNENVRSEALRYQRESRTERRDEGGSRAQAAPFRLDGLQPTPEQVRVQLKLDRAEFLLGESIVVDYEMTNSGQGPAPYERGGMYPTLRLNDCFRMSAVKLDENGKPTGDPVAKWPMPENHGGPVSNFKLQPGESHTTTLFVTRYLRFLEPGRYRLRIENVDRDEQAVYAAGETDLTLKQPTLQQARTVFVQMKKAPRAAYEDSQMKFLRDAADFEAMHQPIYLTVLKEFAEQGDTDALTSLERSERADANAVLVAAITRALDRDDWQAARKVFAHVKPSLPFPNWFDNPQESYDQPQRDRVARSWQADFAPVLTRLARRLTAQATVMMRERTQQPPDADERDPAFRDYFGRGFFPPDHPQALLTEIDYIYRCVGGPADFADCLQAYAMSIELTKTLPLETRQYFRPRGSAFGFGHTVFRLLQRGAAPPAKPSHPGEAAAFAFALRNQPAFRPQGWQAEVMKWLTHDTPYLAEVILDHLPEPVPQEVLDYLPTAMANSYVDLQISACHLARKNPRALYREPLAKILETAKDPYLRKFAVDAARANGLTARYDANAPFVDQATENQ